MKVTDKNKATSLLDNLSILQSLSLAQAQAYGTTTLRTTTFSITTLDIATSNILFCVESRLVDILMQSVIMLNVVVPEHTWLIM